MKKLVLAILVLLVTTPVVQSQITLRNIGGNKQKREAKVKNFRGVVADQRGKPITGARITIRNMKDNTTRTATTDEMGAYLIRGLTPDVDYELRADFRGVLSEKKAVSAFLDREDNLVNFDLDIAIVAAGGSSNETSIEIQTTDFVQLKGGFELPKAVPAPIPAVLLLHGYGEDRRAWDRFRTQLLAQGWAVLALDLRGHGESKTKNRRPIEALPEWRSSPHDFAQDIDPALDWMKRQPRVDSKKIVIIGYDIGANLALMSSGKYPEVRTIVAIKPVLDEALAMAGSAQDFRPHSVLVIANETAEGNSIKQYAKDPFRVLAQPVSSGTSKTMQSKAISDAIFQWLKETF